MSLSSQILMHPTCTGRSRSRICSLGFSMFLQIKQGLWAEPSTAGLTAVTSVPPCPMPPLWPAEGLMNLQVVHASGPSSVFPVSKAEAGGHLQPLAELPCLLTARLDTFSKGCETAPPVFSGGQHRYGRIWVSSRACDHPSLCSPHGLVSRLVALRLARRPQQGCPLQKVFYYHLLMPLETWGFSLSAHSAPNAFLPLVFTLVAFTLFHPLWLSAEKVMSAGLQSSPR